MKYLASLVLALVFVAVSVFGEESTLAESCDPAACQLPDCRCSSTDIPGNLAARDTPQFVLVTFDDGVNVINIDTYRTNLYNRHNSNGCKVGSTFFVNHEYTSYQLINELYNEGFEIALHSMSHQTPQTYWQQATYEDMMMEFGDQKIQMAHFANIPYEELKGVRIPFLQMTGDASFQVMAEVGLEYDSTWGATNSINPGMWPYTLDYASTQECMIGPCPESSIPGPWVKPMVSWLDLNGTACAMVDACFAIPSLDDADGWFTFILGNFERHYLGNRSPFGFYIHEWYLTANPAVMEAWVRFMDMINTMHDVFMVNAADVVDWTKNPIPVDEYAKKDCRTFTRTGCPAASCGPLRAEHNNMDYWMAICNVCPAVYPWLGNPLGLPIESE